MGKEGVYLTNQLWCAVAGACLTMAVGYLTVMASPALVEKTFSINGKVFHPDGFQLKDNNFETVMMIKCTNDTFWLVSKNFRAIYM